MSIFRKRSGSQSSFLHGPDEISVSRIRPDTITKECRADTIQSTRSSCSDVDPLDFAIHESCVVRNFPKHKSSHLRFLAWVAYTRKYTDESITDIERRTCPLLWCREQFASQDDMLKHVWNCPHLSKGLYWCFHCQKPERVGKFQCKRCQGIPSRTDRMASVAKKIFSKLGSKANRHDQYAHSEGGRSWANFHSVESNSTDFKASKLYDENMDWNHIQEMPNTSVCPEMPGDWAAASHELPNTYISEMLGTEIPFEMPMSMPMTMEDVPNDTWDDNFYMENWDMPPPPVPKKVTSPKPATLRVDTSFSSLTASMFQGRIPQRNNSAHWPETPLSPNIISPLSAGPVFSSAGTSAIEVSPTDSDTSGNSFFTDSGYSSATTTISTWNMPTIPSVCEQQSPISKTSRGKKRAREEDEPVFEDWIHESAFATHTTSTEIIQTSSNIHLDAAHVQQVNVHSEHALLHSSNVTQELVHSNPEDCQLGPRPRPFTAHWCDAPTLVHSFSEALDAHIEHTKSALRDLPSTALTQELLAMSKTSMVSIGLEVLAGILEGRKPTAIVQVFAFTHIACAFVIATQHDDGTVLGDVWFGDVLGWVNDLATMKQRALYMQIAKSIWMPVGSVHIGQQPDVQLHRSTSSSSSNSSSSSKTRTGEVVYPTNALFEGCKHFLDVLGSYAHSEAGSAYMSDIGLIKELLPEESYSDEEDHHLENVQGQLQNTQFDLAGLDFGHVDEESLASFMRAADDVLLNSLSRNPSAASSHGGESPSRHNLISYQSLQHQSFSTPALVVTHPSPPQPMARSLSSDQNQNRAPTVHNQADIQPSASAPVLSSPFPPPSRPQSLLEISTPSHPISKSASKQPKSTKSQHTAPASASTPSSNAASLSLPNKALTTDRSPHSSTTPSACPLCEYHPTGVDRWKASNLRRHKRTQHPELLGNGSGEAKMHPCRFEGCGKTFRRSDNLRGHQREKGHWVGGVISLGVAAERDVKQGGSGMGVGERKEKEEGLWHMNLGGGGKGGDENASRNFGRGGNGTGKKRRIEIAR